VWSWSEAAGSRAGGELSFSAGAVPLLRHENLAALSAGRIADRVSFLLVYLQYGYSVQTAAGCVLAAMLVVVTFTDIDEGIIPDVITYPGMLIGLPFSFFTIGIKSALIGMLGFGLVFFLIALLSRGGMGGGDVKLVAVIGAFVGPLHSVLVFILSSLAGGLWAIGLLLFRGAGRKTEVRFGTFLALAALLVFLYGQQLLDFYLGLF
jgi:leader peptidase (prepilin peptidase)/N-methyltransferase